ncbi:MAG: hypothetical protein NC244_11065, partial [Alistipes senegalensis]|nr:hypothetical protein [Alistipes senegalensis]
ESPYIVDNWEDFRTIDTASAGIYVQWADTGNKIIDFNDIMPEGFSETINIPAHVDFNGWTLKNFHSTVSNWALKCSSASDAVIENLILENFYITSQTLFYGSVLLKNCIISGIVQYGTIAIVFRGCGLERCSVNIKVNASGCNLVSSGGFSSPKSQITNSDIVSDISCSGSTVSVCDYPIKNSRIYGKIQSNAPKITLGNSNSMSNVFNLETDSSLTYTGTGISVYNSDFATAPDSKSFIGVTSEQLKNAEYLYNIGFPIGVE